MSRVDSAGKPEPELDLELIGRILAKPAALETDKVRAAFRLAGGGRCRKS